MMQKLERRFRVAFARIITDLIEADFVVDEAEMKSFERLISEKGLDITASMLVEAKKMDFAKAVSILSELNEWKRGKILKTLRQLSMSDGTCVPLEAVQILAVKQAFMHRARLYSVPKESVDMDNMTVIFIENEENTPVNGQIRRNLAAITDTLRLAGFEFVYIPGVVDDFRLLEGDYLEKVVKYMIPSASAEQTARICDRLCNLTTSDFCRDLLYKKSGLNLIDARPSLLVKINDSDVIEQFGNDDTERIRLSNFLQFEIVDDVLTEVGRLVDTYKQLVTCPIITENKPRSGKFLYYGFHRSLFNLIAYGREQKEYRLVFDISRHTASVYLESTDEAEERISLKLNPRETALYLMIARKSLEGRGLDWRENIPAREKKALLAEYNRIYSFIGKSRTTVEYKDRTQTNHIRNTIYALRGIANVEMFVPECDRSDSGSFYRIKAAPSYVKVIEDRNGVCNH